MFYQSFAQYAELYQQYPALRFGKQNTLYAQGKPGIFAISRANSPTGNELNKEQELLIIFNTSSHIESLDVLRNHTKRYNNAKLVHLSGPSEGDNKIAPLSFSIYQLK